MKYPVAIWCETIIFAMATVFILGYRLKVSVKELEKIPPEYLKKLTVTLLKKLLEEYKATGELSYYPDWNSKMEKIDSSLDPDDIMKLVKFGNLLIGK